MRQGHFLENLVLECLPAKDSKFRFRVYHRPFSYITSLGDIITVPVGFMTDFASVPWIFRRLIPATGRYNEATVIHDYLCYLSGQEPDRKEEIRMRKFADTIFLECMEALGVKGWKRKLMYAGVSMYTSIKAGEHGKHNKHGKRRYLK